MNNRCAACGYGTDNELHERPYGRGDVSRVWNTHPFKARSADQNPVDREMEKLKAMGITVSVKLAPAGPTPRASSIIKDAAERHGIAYDSERGSAGTDE